MRLPVLLAALLGAGGRDCAGAILTNRFVARDGAIQVTHNGGTTPLFIRAVNLGVGIPGTEPGDLAASREQYDRWLARIRGMGFNTVRIYTLHYPRFYEALRDYNLQHPDAPLYLFHGIWLDEDNPTHDLHNLTGIFDQGIVEGVGAVHGQISIAERFGRASGNYTADISPWVMGWIIGREISPEEVAVTDAAHPQDTNYLGSHLSLPSGTPTEVWLTARLDFIARHEQQMFGEERPVSASSWPTLDPLTHPTESIFSKEDVNSVDLTNLDSSRFFPGVFASYHAYPYYPDWMSEDPAYTSETDADGPNSYLGYLKALRNHYYPIPLIIAEFGVPSSWGDAHVAHSGMNHGGHDEEQQGRYAVRMFRNMVEADCAGGALFAWIDEWWKDTWIAEELDFPLIRRPIWLNVTAPEQNFGLIAFDEAFPVFQPVPTSGSPGPIGEITWAATHRFFHLEIATTAAIEQQPLVIGFDTYRDDAGETILPGGRSTSVRSEFALVLDGSGAQLHVTEAYDLFGIWHALSDNQQLYHSIPTDGAPWRPVRWLSNRNHASDDQVYQFPATTNEIGRLRVSTNGTFVSSMDAVAIGDGKVRLRLPWTLLQFTDPSRLIVMDDDRATPLPAPNRETAISDGIRLVVSQAGGLGASDRLLWTGWETAPATTEREKASVAILEDYLLNAGATGEIRIRIVARTTDSLTLDWDGGGLLNQAPTPTGPWAVVGQGPPTTLSVDSASAAFFRVQR